VTETPDITVTLKVSKELAEQLKEWSDLVQIRIIETPDTGTGYDMEVRAVFEQPGELPS